MKVCLDTRKNECHYFVVYEWIGENGSLIVVIYLYSVTVTYMWVCGWVQRVCSPLHLTFLSNTSWLHNHNTEPHFFPVQLRVEWRSEALDIVTGFCFFRNMVTWCVILMLTFIHEIWEWGWLRLSCLSVYFWRIYFYGEKKYGLPPTVLLTQSCTRSLGTSLPWRT